MMEDHSEDPSCDTNRGLWAKSVAIDDHVVVKGTSGIGAYVVWNCRIQTLEVSGVSFGSGQVRGVRVGVRACY